MSKNLKKLTLLVLTGLFLLTGATSCQEDYKKKDKAIQKIEANLAKGNYRAARKAVGKIPGQYESTVITYNNKINSSELAYLLSKGKTEKAKELFIKSCTNQDFFVDNASTAVGLVDDDFIVKFLSGWKIVDNSGNTLTFKEEAINCNPDDCSACDDNDISVVVLEGNGENNNCYNKVVTEYNGVIESVVYSAILSNNVELAEKCIMLYMPLAKEVSRKHQKKYSANHFDLKYTEDNHYREEAEQSLASLQKIKSIETRFNGTQFARGSAELNEKAKLILDELAAYMGIDKDIRVKVIGHTSADGNKNKNKALSTERAEAVTAYLIGKGVSATRLQSEGVGSEQLKDKDNPNSEENCRTEFCLIK